MITRREFLSNTTKASLLSLFANPFCDWGLGIRQQGLPSWEHLTEYARWCPTVHNLQPHKLKAISETQAQLYYDPQRLLPVGDPGSAFATVALGIFIEHLSIVAGAYAKKVETKQIVNPVSTNAQGLTLFATLELQDREENETLNKELILKRRTSRGHYDGKALQQKTLDRLQVEVERWGHRLAHSSDPELIDFIVGLNQETLFYDLESKAEREELDKLFRYTKEEAETKKDGLWTKCMGFPGKLVKSVFHHHERWQKGLRKKMLASYYRSSFKGTSTICWVSGSFENTNDWLLAGRMLARTWLAITEENAYIQPLGSLVTNVSANKKINEKIGLENTDGKLWLLFRAGYSPEPARSYRLSTNDIIIT